MQHKDEQGKFIPLCEKPTKLVGVKIDPDMLELLDVLAKKKGVSRSDLIRSGIEMVLQEIC